MSSQSCTWGNRAVPKRITHSVWPINNPISVDAFMKGVIGKTPLFALVMGHTELSNIEGLSIAGIPGQMHKTPPADAEVIYHDRWPHPWLPQAPNRAPTPAVISAAALDMMDAPFHFISTGLPEQPQNVPFHPLYSMWGQNPINSPSFQSQAEVLRLYTKACDLGKQLAHGADYIILGESIPAGTTSAGLYLSARGYQGISLVSSTMKHPPAKLRYDITQMVSNRIGANLGYPFGTLAAWNAAYQCGDPTIVTLAGLMVGASKAGKLVMMAGGSQMAAAIDFAIGLEEDPRITMSVAVCTTTYVAPTPDSNVAKLFKYVNPDVPVMSTFMNFQSSFTSGFKRYDEGYVKEGVGAGGLAAAAIFKTKAYWTNVQEAAEQRWASMVLRSAGSDAPIARALIAP